MHARSDHLLVTPTSFSGWTLWVCLAKGLNGVVAAVTSTVCGGMHGNNTHYAHLQRTVKNSNNGARELERAGIMY